MMQRLVYKVLGGRYFLSIFVKSLRMNQVLVALLVSSLLALSEVSEKLL